MKSFIIAAIILIVVTAAVIISAVYIVKITDELLKDCDDLIADSDNTSIDDILSKWRKCRTFLTFTVNKLDIERADNAFRAVEIHRYNENEYKYRLHELKSALRSIAESGRLSFEIIF